MGRVKLNFFKMKRCLLSALAVGFCLSANVMAQVPSYVPTNGLVGYWPFNGNPNDESGNGNNGTVNGATLTTDRNGVANKAYSFDGNDWIQVADNNNLNTPKVSVSICIKSELNNFQQVVYKVGLNTAQNEQYSIPINLNDNNQINFDLKNNSCIPGQGWVSFSNSCNFNQWKHIVFTHDGFFTRFYINGQLINSQNNLFDVANCPGGDLIFGIAWDLQYGLLGQIDDIGIWNRALTQQEISALYNSCGNEITSQPTNSVNTIGSNAQFSVNAVAGSTYQWQSNPSNFGWQNVPNNTSYSGAATNTLTVSNTTISNHNQPFRAIVNAGGCIDTSNVAQIIIGDTCLTTVTDTLIINTTLGLPSPNNENTILIYPNPASDHITIDNGNYTAMAGYTIKIENNAGQQVFQSLINQAQFYVDLSTWSGNGLYFVHLIDAQGNTVTVRKIVLQ